MTMALEPHELKALALELAAVMPPLLATGTVAGARPSADRDLLNDAHLRVDAALPVIMDAMEWVTPDQSRTLALVQYALEQSRDSLQSML